MVARRRLEPSTWEPLRAGLQKARQLVGKPRLEAVTAASAALESELELLGASGVEDRLQPGVQETLESLRSAGIRVWVLTGDKVETAVNVSFSCGHLKPGTEQLHLIECYRPDECLSKLQALRYVEIISLQHFYQTERFPDYKLNVLIDELVYFKCNQNHRR